MMIDMSNNMSAQHKHNHTNNAINDNSWQTVNSQVKQSWARALSIFLK